MFVVRVRVPVPFFIFEAGEENERLPPSLYGYGVSFVLHRGETFTAPHFGRFPPGAGTTGQSHFKPPQQHQSRIFVAATDSLVQYEMSLKGGTCF